MARVILHLGTHKTGSTSLQRALDASRADLLGAGWLYPMSGRQIRKRAPEPRAMALSLLPPDRSTFRAAVAALLSEIEDSASPNVILSSEAWCRSSKAESLAAVVTAMRAAGHSTEGVLYLRNRALYGRSRYREWTQNWRNALPLPEYVARNAPAFDYIALCQRMRDLFGADLHVRSYERAGNLPEDFARMLGLPELAKQPRANPSLDAVQTEVQRLANARGLDLPGGTRSMDEIFGDQDFWTARRDYGEALDIPILNPARPMVRRLRQATGFDGEATAYLLRPPDPPRHDIRSLSPCLERVLAAHAARLEPAS